MNFKLTKVDSAFYDNYHNIGLAPEQQLSSAFAWLVLGMANLSKRIAKSKSPPFIWSKPVQGGVPICMPSKQAQELYEFLAQYRLYIIQLKDAFAGHTAHPTIQLFLDLLQRNNLLTDLPVNYPHHIRDVQYFFATLRADANSLGFQQNVNAWKERYLTSSRSVRQVLQQRAKTHPQRMICRLVLGWSNQAGIPWQPSPVHDNFAMAPALQAEPLDLKRIHAQIQSLLDVTEHSIAPHCFLDAIWHHVRIPFNGYRTYLTLVLDAGDPMLNTNTILRELAQFWQHETVRWGGGISVVNAPEPWKFDNSGFSFFIPSHHYCGSGFVHADDTAKRSELYTQLVQFTCASQQVISLLPESDVPLIGTYARNLALQLVPDDVAALPEVNADQLAIETDEH